MRHLFRRFVVLGFWVVVSSVAADPPSQSTTQPATQPTSQPTTKPAQHLIVEGQLFDHIGAGVRGVKVHVFVPAGGGRTELASATTGKMGDFKVYHSEPVYGKLIVTCANPGFKPHEVEVESVRGELPPFVDYQMEGDLKLAGVVRDQLKDAPIVGAKVVLRAAYTEWSAATDASGKFEIQDLPPGRMRITIEAEGYARLTQGVRTGAAPDTEPAEPEPESPFAEPAEEASGKTTAEGELVFLLKPERVVHLTATDADGRPIPKVVVESLVEATNDFRTAATDEAGQLTFRGLSLDTTRITFRLTHPEYVSSVSFDRTADLPADHAESSHTLTMTSAASIRGKVTADDGRPLGGARLTVGPSSDEVLATAWSDLDGTFTLSSVPAGEAVVTVHLVEYAPRLFVAQADPKKPTTLEVVLSPAAQVAGRVLDPDGQPVGGALVMTDEWHGYDTLDLRAMTDADGHFTLPGAPDDEFAVNVLARGFKPLEGRMVRGGGTDLVLQFTEAQTQPTSSLIARLKPGQEAPAFEATTLDGKPVKLADFKGKYLFVDFWATWCGPCVVEVPNLVALHRALGARKDFAMLGVSLDSDEKTVRKFLADKKLVWPQVFGAQAGANRMADRYGAGAIPCTYLIGPDSKIVAADLGGKSLADEVRKRIEKPRLSGDAAP